MADHTGKAVDFILENLAIGEYDEALAPQPKISALLCVARERDIRMPRLLYHKVPIVDMQPIPTDQMKEAVDWIHHAITQGHNVLVFCNEDIGRSPSVVIGYLCCRLGYTFTRAFEHVATIRPKISILPNLIVSIEETKNVL